jgi:hypothetical protein
MAEGSHWYDKNGAIIDCKPKEAKEKNYYPGVTMVLGIKQNWGLTRYTQQQHMEAVYNTPKLPEETEAEYFKRCRIIADEHRRKASKIGSAFHTQMARHFLDKYVFRGGSQLIDNMYDLTAQWARSYIIDAYLVEAPMVNHKYRYGGTIDLVAETVWGMAIIDFKTRDISHPGVKKDGALKKIRGLYYDSDMIQLSAYKMLVGKNYHLMSLVVSKNPDFPGVFPYIWSKEEEITGWRNFLATRRLFEVERHA